MVRSIQSPTVSTFFNRVAGLSSRIAAKFQTPVTPSVQATRIIPWIEVDGDRTLLVDYPLSNTSVVFEVGGFKGAWSKEIEARYGCDMYIFEPVDAFFKELKTLFGRNDNVHLYEFGLSDADTTATIAAIGDTASTHKTTGDSQKIQLKDIDGFIKKSGIKRIDLMNINIEGGEYALLERMIDTGFIKNVTNIQVQFHDFVPNADSRMAAIQAKLGTTHKLTYQYPYVWENWQRKGSQ